MAVNTVTVIGNLVEDPELRFTPSGVAMAKIRVAVNRSWRDRNTNDWKEETSFFGGTVWREAAENVAESLQKGARVIISGSLEQRSWETQDGDKRSIVELRIDELGPESAVGDRIGHPYRSQRRRQLGRRRRWWRLVRGDASSSGGP